MSNTSSPTTPPTITGAELVLPPGDLSTSIGFFTNRLGFRVDAISPADAPSTAVLSGHGVRIRLDDTAAGPGLLRLGCTPRDPGRTVPPPLVAPNGTRVEYFDADPPIVLPPEDQRLVISRLPAEDRSAVGRAGMRYRDLIPERHGGRFIASHITIPGGGPVPDYVHFHKIRFQMIYCRRGWVKVVYEDQGPPFVLEAGDCVLQPPEIRHRVLDASPGLEVVEVASPARHQTLADHDLRLPTGRVLLERDFGGQRFVRHRAATATWEPWRYPGFVARDLGLEAATSGLARVRVVHNRGAVEDPRVTHRHEFAFWFLLEGSLVLETAGSPPEPLNSGDSVTVPAGLGARFTGCSADLQLLEILVPR